MIDKLREHLCNDKVMRFFMEPVEGLSLIRHGLVRVRRANRWFIYISPAKDLFVYDHNRFLKNPEYKKYFEEQEDNIIYHITDFYHHTNVEILSNSHKLSLQVRPT